MYLKRNVALFYVTTFFQSMWFSYPIWYFFLVNYLKFWAWDAIFINTFIWLVIMLFEVPSWWWADRFGRKKIHIMGSMSVLFGTTFYLWADKVYLFFISSFFLWLGYSLISWNLEALIHDNIEEDWKWESEYNKIQSNEYILMYLGRAFSALFAWYLYFHHQTFPYIANIVCYSIGLILLFFIHSPKQELSHEKNDFAHIKKALVFLSSRKDMLLLIFFTGVVYSWLGNIYWFTYQPYLEIIWVDIKDLWVIYFIISIVSAAWSYIIKKLQVRFDAFFITKIMLFALFLSSLMFAFFDNILWVIPILVISLFFGFMMILWNTYLIKTCPKTHKSTILSIYWLWISLWYSVLCTIAWYIMQVTSLKVLYNFLPIVIFILFILFIILDKKINHKLRSS